LRDTIPLVARQTKQKVWEARLWAFRFIELDEGVDDAVVDVLVQNHVVVMHEHLHCLPSAKAKP
jgi:hypothetical protein